MDDMMKDGKSEFNYKLLDNRDTESVYLTAKDYKSATGVATALT